MPSIANIATAIFKPQFSMQRQRRAESSEFHQSFFFRTMTALHQVFCYGITVALNLSRRKESLQASRPHR
jgi:hypothetical protein